MRNVKGFEMAITTVTIFAVLVIALAVISLYVFHHFGTAGAGVQSILGGTANKSGTMDVGAETTSVIKGGICTGEPGFTKCGYYYEDIEGLGGTAIRGSSGCKVPSCRMIGGYVHGYVTGSDRATCTSSNDPSEESRWKSCPVECSKFTEVGKSLCECAGCTWKTT